MSASRVTRLPGRRPPLLAAFAGLVVLLAACGPATPSAETVDIVSEIPFIHGEAYSYSLTNDRGEIFGEAVLTTEANEDGFTLLQTFTEIDPPPGAPLTSDVISVQVRYDNLQPVDGTRTTIRRDGDGDVTREETRWSYGLEQGEPIASIQSLDEDGGIDGERTVGPLRDHYYDNESSLWLWRTLLFEVDWERNYVSMNPFQGSQQTVNLWVSIRQTIAVPAGTFDVWRLQVRNGRAVRVAWINAQPPHQIVQWDNGTTVFRLLRSLTR
ncbi:MAG: hypothetical protein V3R95_03925 [Dehalococcoidia bacterium]